MKKTFEIVKKWLNKNQFVYIFYRNGVSKMEETLKDKLNKRCFGKTFEDIHVKYKNEKTEIYFGPRSTESECVLQSASIPEKTAQHMAYYVLELELKFKNLCRIYSSRFGFCEKYDWSKIQFFMIKLDKSFRCVVSWFNVCSFENGFYLENMMINVTLFLGDSFLHWKVSELRYKKCTCYICRVS